MKCVSQAEWEEHTHGVASFFWVSKKYSANLDLIQRAKDEFVDQVNSGEQNKMHVKFLWSVTRPGHIVMVWAYHYPDAHQEAIEVVSF